MKISRFVLGFLLWNVGSVIVWKVLQFMILRVIFPNYYSGVPQNPILLLYIPLGLTIVTVIISLIAKQYAFALGIIAAYFINVLLYMPDFPFTYPGMIRGIPMYITGPLHIDFYWYAIG